MTVRPKSPRTGVVRDPRYLMHLTANGHPENPQRLEAIYGGLDAAGMEGLFVEIAPRLATSEELLLVHSRGYLKRLAATHGKEPRALSPDTLTSAGSYRAALLAAGGLCRAIEQVLAGELAHAFALVRPPGHHAERSRALGYCLINNVALGARFARETLGLDRVLIVDWDVHHGNGTQHAFEYDNSVLFFSTHQYPHFPGTGLFTETGRGRGEGFTVNVPLPRGYGDAEFVALYDSLLRALALEFEPQLILVSAGFDIHAADPLGGMRVTPAGFAGLTRSLMEIAEICCEGRLVLVLEGGYHLPTLTASVQAVIRELAGETVSVPSELAARADRKKMAYVRKRVTHVHRRFWKSFK